MYRYQIGARVPSTCFALSFELLLLYLNMADGSEPIVSVALDSPGLDRAEGGLNLNPNFSLQPDAEFYGTSNVVFQVSMPCRSEV